MNALPGKLRAILGPALALLTLAAILPLLVQPLAAQGQPQAIPSNCSGNTIVLLSGDAGLSIERPQIGNASSLGCQVSGMLRIQLGGNNVGDIPISGSVDAYNQFTSSSIGAFELGIAGLTLKVAGSSFQGGALLLTQTRIKIPDSWGGLEAAVPKTFTVNEEGLMGPIFSLPAIETKKITLELWGLFGIYNAGYKIEAHGVLKLPDIGKTEDCFIKVDVTLYVDALGRPVMEIQTPGEAGAASAVAHRSQIALPAGQAALVPVAMPLRSGYLPLPESLPPRVWEQLRTEEVQPAGLEPAPATQPGGGAGALAADQDWTWAEDTPAGEGEPTGASSAGRPALGQAEDSPVAGPPAPEVGWGGLEIVAGWQCMGKGIPIGTTGFELTAVEGTLTLMPDQESVALEVTFSSQIQLLESPLLTVDGATEFQWSPEFAFSLQAVVTVLEMFEAGGARISVSESDGLRLQVWWGNLFYRGDFAIHAWLQEVRWCGRWDQVCYDHHPLLPTCTTTCATWNSHTKFHFTGSVACEVGVAKGGIWSGRTIPYPCGCRWCSRWWGGYPCCSWCWVSIDVPPVAIWLAGADAQFGEFTGDRWGLKGTVSFLEFSIGFYVDHTGELAFGDVSSYRLVDGRQLRAAREARDAAALSGGPGAAYAGDETFAFPAEDQAQVRFELPLANRYRVPVGVQDVITHAQVISQTDTAFTVKADVPLAVSLISPDGVEITPDNYDQQPGGYVVDYTRTVTIEMVTDPGPGPGRTRWRFIPASDAAALRTVDVSLDATAVFTDVSVDDEQVMGYAEIEPGAHSVEVHPSGGGGPSLSVPIDVVAGTDHTVLLVGDEAPELLVLEDDNSTPDAETGRVRVVNAAPGAVPLDVTLDGVSFQDIGYRQASDYAVVAAGAYGVTAASGALDPALGATLSFPGVDSGIEVIYGDKVAWAGDVNGDGYDDLLVADNADDADRGKVYLYLGTAGEPNTAAAWVEAGENTGDKFGISAAGAGDVNGDGYADVLVGAYGYDYERGKVYLYLGSAGGLASEPAWSALGADQGDLLGGAVAGAGDVDGDGFGDVLVGASGYLDDQGQVHLYYGSATGVQSDWTPTGSLGTARSNHTATLLADGRVLAAGGRGGDYIAISELYDPATGLWTATGSLNYDRMAHTATRLSDGRVLLAGGQGSSAGGYPLPSAELYNPATGQFALTGSLSIPRAYHSATALANGTVLVVGGRSDWDIVSSAEIYNPATGQWTPTGSMSTTRYGHTAALLANGRVLVVGGSDWSSVRSSAEVYNPATGQWAPTGSLGTARTDHTATLLGDGRVLVAGGADWVNVHSSAELYDPATGQWTPTGSMGTARARHTATLLADGRVLVAGGEINEGALSSAEVYDPATGQWAPAGAMAAARWSHTATLLAGGRVLVAAGREYSEGGFISGAELYDPEARDPWSAIGECWYDQFGSSLAGAGDVDGDGYDDLVVGAHTYPCGDGWRGRAYLYRGSADGPAADPSWIGEGEDYFHEFGISVAGAGDVNGDGYDDLLVGAYGYPYVAAYQGKAYLYAGSASGLSPDPAWTGTGESAGDRFGNSVSAAGDVDRDGYDDFLVGAYGYPGGAFGGRFTLYYGSPSGVGASGWAATGSLGSPRQQHTATALSDGRVLVAGGWGGGASTELYDPATGLWAPTGSLHAPKTDHTATLLADGRVLVAAGQGSPNGAEIYDPATGQWTVTGSLGAGRFYHTATRLADGRVLVVGGEGSGGSNLASAELYNPATGQWTATGSLHTGRSGHTATPLADGRVLVAGGYGGANLNSAELYDPATGQWTYTANMGQGRSRHAAARLPDGSVLVVGGEGDDYLSSAELYNPLTDQWAPAGSLSTARVGPTATPLPGGQVLVAGGKGPGWVELASAELYDPATGQWTATGNLGSARWVHTATALDDGRVLVAGGESAGGPLSSAELFSASRAPWIASGAAEEYLGISVAGGGDANGDAHADLLAGAPGGAGGKAFLYYGALGLSATAADVPDRDVQTLLVAQMDGSADALALLQVRDAVHMEALRVVTSTMYVVDQAITGTWTLNLVGDTGDANLAISAVAAPNPPILKQLTVDAGDLANTLVTYRLLSDYRPVTMHIFANDGPITETTTITLPPSIASRPDITRTEVITLYQGIEAATLVLSDALAVSNALITTTVDLSALESGDYRLWVRVEDGVGPPVQGYVWGADTYASGKLPRAWNQVRVAARDYDAAKQLAGAALIPIDQTDTWAHTWATSMAAEIRPEGLTVEFSPYDHPDVDGYLLEVEEGGVTHVMTTGLTVYYHRDPGGQPVGDPVHYVTFRGLSPRRTYSVRIAALDLDGGLEAWSQAEEFSVPLGDMSLSAAEPAVELPAGQGVVTATLLLEMTEDLFSDVHLALDTDQLPPGISLHRLAYEPQGGAGGAAQTQRWEGIPAPARLGHALRDPARGPEANLWLLVHAGIAVEQGVPAAGYTLPFVAHSGELERRAEVTLLVAPPPPDPLPPGEPVVLEPPLPLPSCATAIVVTIPAGAFPGGTGIQFVQGSNNVEDPPGLRFDYSHFTLTALDGGGQPIQPAKSLALALDYDPACLGGLDEAGLHLRLWGGAAGWGAGGVACTPNPAHGRLDCSLSHVGRFALFEPAGGGPALYLPLIFRRR